MTPNSVGGICLVGLKRWHAAASVLVTHSHSLTLFAFFMWCDYSLHHVHDIYLFLLFLYLKMCSLFKPEGRKAMWFTFGIITSLLFEVILLTGLTLEVCVFGTTCVSDIVVLQNMNICGDHVIQGREYESSAKKSMLFFLLVIKVCHHVL